MQLRETKSMIPGSVADVRLESERPAPLVCGTGNPVRIVVLQLRASRRTRHGLHAAEREREGGEIALPPHVSCDRRRSLDSTVPTPTDALSTSLYSRLSTRLHAVRKPVLLPAGMILIISPTVIKVLLPLGQALVESRTVRSI